jgi:molybdopterin synthase catalytic subunit
MADNFLVRVSDSVVDPSEALAFVQDPAAGGSCLFVGTVRDGSEAGEVTGILYEAWAELAETKLRQIAEMMLEDAQKVALVHRFGDLAVGEVAVAVAASAVHREQAFASCRSGIERIKREVPIWKKELLRTGGSSWVMGS